jgi:hypothetical protein
MTPCVSNINMLSVPHEIKHNTRNTLVGPLMFSYNANLILTNYVN